MTKEKMIIPKTITVGFKKRTDTYTGKLGYVVYTDEKGVLRKEPSWKSWRDKEIEPQTFENVPTSGFVLNKKVGETRCGWNPRMAWVRIYDPRGFEFEITVANLLYILEECTSTKGKGLEGEFVYSWDRADLVLLPVSSQEYGACQNFTSLQTKKITKDMMKEGRVYKNKQNEKVLYLGKQDYYEFDYVDGKYYSRIEKSKKVHVFYNYDIKKSYSKTDNYWIQTGFTKIAEMVSEETSPDFPEKYQEYKNSIYGSKVVSFEVIEQKNYLLETIDNCDYWRIPPFITEKNGRYIRMSLDRVCNSSTPLYRESDKYTISYGITEEGNAYYSYDHYHTTVHGISGYYGSTLDRKTIDSLKLYSIMMVSENGTKTEIF
jgi:hypothetical protein